MDSTAPAAESIDMCRALELLAGAAGQAGRDGEPGIVDRALALARVGDGQLDTLREHSLRELYAQDRLPVPLTLGALVVFDAAQRAEDRGCTAAGVLDHATEVALRFVDLLPDRAFVAALASTEQRP